jgi:N-acetylmuramoyl-L-alanine amidase
MLDIKTLTEKINESKFRYAIFLLLTILFIATAVVRIYNGKAADNPQKIEVSDVIETMNLNNNNIGKVIVIDPGHGVEVNMEKEPLAPGSSKLRVKAPVGAIGVFTKTPEYQIDWDVALKLKGILENKGFTVVMTKNNIAENPSGIERAEIGNKANARLVVRIHADSFKDSSVQGTSVLAPDAIDESRKSLSSESSRCANIILNVMANKAGVKDRGVVLRDDLTAFNWSNVPTLLIEMGFLSNKDEDMMLNREEYQDKLADAIADGIEEAVKIEWNE